MPKKRPESQPSSAPLTPAEEAQRTREHLRERFPQLYARAVILEKLAALQQIRGGEFPPRYVFVHMPDYILNIRRIGAIDLAGTAVAFEVYPFNDIVPGIIWVPFDHIWWLGTTDDPYGVEQIGLHSKEDGQTPAGAAYREARLKLAGLPPRA